MGKGTQVKPKLHKLAVTLDDNGSAIVHDAIDRHREAAGETGKRSQEGDGRALVAICAVWREMAEARIKAARG